MKQTKNWIENGWEIEKLISTIDTTIITIYRVNNIWENWTLTWLPAIDVKYATNSCSKMNLEQIMAYCKFW